MLEYDDFHKIGSPSIGVNWITPEIKFIVELIWTSILAVGAIADFLSVFAEASHSVHVSFWMMLFLGFNFPASFVQFRLWVQNIWPIYFALKLCSSALPLKLKCSLYSLLCYLDANNKLQSFVNFDIIDIFRSNHQQFLGQ